MQTINPLHGGNAMKSAKLLRSGIRILSILLAASLVIAYSPARGVCKSVYKIGGIFAVTGPASFLGDPEKKSMILAIEAINKGGGIDGHLLEPVIYDTEGDPSKAVMAVNKLINKDMVIAIIGPSRTPTTMAVKPVVERAKIPFISCAAGNKIVLPPNPWVFKTAQSDILAVSAIYNYMKKHGIKKVGILTVANAFGESGREQLLSQAAKFGITVVADESFGHKDTDMTAQLTKIRKQGPDAVICWGTNPGPAVIAKNMKQLGMKIPLYQSHGVASPKFIELAGDAAEGIILPAGKILVADLLPDSDPQKSILKAYIKAYKAKFNETPSGFGGYAYDAIQLLAKAMKGSEGDKDKIRNRLEKIKGHVGISGIFNFTPQDHNGLDPSAFVMVKIENGTWKLAE